MEQPQAPRDYEGEGFVVQCMSCGQVYHETTEFFSGARSSSGKMFRLRKQYGPAGENWLSFPQDEACRDADLECPGCGNPYTQGTKVRVTRLDPFEEFAPQEDAELAALEAGDRFLAAVDSVTASEQAEPPEGAEPAEPAPEPLREETAIGKLKQKATSFKVGGKK